MFWLIPSLLNSFFDSVQNALGKRGAQKVDVLSAAWAQRFFALFIIIPLVVISNSFKPFNSLNSTFWTAALISSSIAVITSIMFMRAVKISPLSLTLPITAFTPVFLLITSPIILGEFPKPLGVLGILSVVFGSYILNLSKKVHGPLEPVFAIFKKEGSRLMFIIAFVWSITSNIDKIAVKNSNPILYSLIFCMLVLFFLTLILLFKRVSIPNIFKNTKVLAPIGLAGGLMFTFQMIAISMTLVANVIAVKRTSAIFGTLWGKMFFKEENIKERLIGVIIMVAGVILIAIS